MGHAGAIISGGKGTAEAKIAAMREAGITVVEGPHLLGRAMKDALARAAATKAAPKRRAAAARKGPRRQRRAVAARRQGREEGGEGRARVGPGSHPSSIEEDHHGDREDPFHHQARRRREGHHRARHQPVRDRRA